MGKTMNHAMNDPSALRHGAVISFRSAGGFLFATGPMLIATWSGHDVGQAGMMSLLLSFLFAGFGMMLLGRARTQGHTGRFGEWSDAFTMFLLDLGALLTIICAVAFGSAVMMVVGMILE